MSSSETIAPIVNGEPLELPRGASITDLVAALGIEGRYAVEVDGRVVPRSEHLRFELVDGARVEVVAAIGGGAR